MTVGTAWYVMECGVERVLPLRADVSYEGEGRCAEDCRCECEKGRASAGRHWVAIVEHDDGSHEDIGCLSLYEDSRIVDGVVAPLRLRWLAVREDYRGRGIGRGLMAAGIAAGEGTGFRWIWGAARSERLSLYESLGARIDPVAYTMPGRPFTYQDVLIGPL